MLEDVGAIVDRRSVTITVDEAQRYANAAGLRDPDYLSGRSACPIYLTTLAMEPQVSVMERLIAGGAQSGVTVQQAVEIVGTLSCPATLDVVAQVESIEVGPRNAAVTTRMAFETPDRAFRFTLLATVIRGGDHGLSSWREGIVGRLAPRSSPPTSTVEIEMDAEQPLRYAEATDERAPFHLSEDAAHELGFPGILAHATNLSALYFEAAHEWLGQPITGLGIAFGAPVFPPCAIAIGLGPACADTPHRYHLDASSAGQQVVRAGFVDVAPAAS